MDTVTFVFDEPNGSGRVGTCIVLWVRGKTLQAYLKDPPLQQQKLLGSTIHRQRLRWVVKGKGPARLPLYYEPRAGETLVYGRYV